MRLAEVTLLQREIDRATACLRVQLGFLARARQRCVAGDLDGSYDELKRLASYLDATAFDELSGVADIVS